MLISWSLRHDTYHDVPLLIIMLWSLSWRSSPDHCATILIMTFLSWSLCYDPYHDVSLLIIMLWSLRWRSSPGRYRLRPRLSPCVLLTLKARLAFGETFFTFILCLFCTARSLTFTVLIFTVIKYRLQYVCIKDSYLKIDVVCKIIDDNIVNYILLHETRTGSAPGMGCVALAMKREPATH